MHTTDHERPFDFLGLPIELLTEIIKALSWMDVLRVRETCRLLCDVTKTREIWAYLVQEHISSKEVAPLLERPVEMHTAHELEHVLLRWKSAEIVWGKDDGRPAIERSFHCEPPGLTHLIQGGRWFLVTSPIGAVTYYDLDAETISGVQLIPAYFPPSPWGTTDIRVAYEVDTTSPLLKFNMAISSRYPMPKQPEAHALHIWSVTTILDDSGHVVGLSASRLALLRHPDKLTTVMDLTLRGSHVASICYVKDHHQDYIGVVRWDQGDKRPYHLQIVHMARSCVEAKILLLPDNRVLLITGTRLRLWDYSAIQQTTDFIPNSVDIDRAVLWTKGFEFRGYLGPKSLVSVFYVGDTTKILVSGYYLYTFSIKSLSNESPPVHELFRYQDGLMNHVHGLGASRGILYHHSEKKFTLMTYGLLDDAQPSSTFLCKNTFLNPSHQSNCLAFDEETGRVVLSRPRATLVYVIDHALMIIR